MSFKSLTKPQCIADLPPALRYGFKLISGVLLLALATQIIIPWQPVPLTWQSTTVIMIGVIYGARLGAHIAALYLVAGLVGLPVFSHFGAGIAKLLGPTGGYLMAFPLAAWLSGYLTKNAQSYYLCKLILANFAATSLIFFAGVTWLSVFMSKTQAINAGLLPFLGTELVKMAIAIALLYSIKYRQRG